jgi:hypothetical protein
MPSTAVGKIVVIIMMIMVVLAGAVGGSELVSRK